MTVDPDRPCRHEDFTAHVEVNRLFPREESAEPSGFAAVVHIWCSGCEEAFTFMGVPTVGMLVTEPTISPDATELRIPIRPRSSEPDFGLGLPGFSIRRR